MHDQEIKKILVVEDETSTRRAMTQQLKSIAKVTVTEAANSEEALRKIKLAPVDLIVTDYNMPEMNGLELIIRAKEMNAEISALLCTAYGTKDLAIEALRVGVVDFIEKPFDSKTFIAAVEKILHKKTGGRIRKIAGYNLKNLDQNILSHLLDGLSNKEIGAKVSLSEQSIKYHLTKIFKMFDVDSREALRDKVKGFMAQPQP